MAVKPAPGLPSHVSQSGITHSRPKLTSMVKAETCNKGASAA